MRQVVTGLRGIVLGVPNLQHACTFYEDVWGLELVATDGSAMYLRARGLEHHILTLQYSTQPELQYIELAVGSEANLDQLYSELSSVTEVALLGPPHRRSPLGGGGYGFELATPGGHRFLISAGGGFHSENFRDRSRPTKLSHVVINSASAEADAAFLTNHLGFRLSDSTHSMEFFRVGPDHHSVAIARSDISSFNHAAFELEDIDGLMRGAGRLRRHGILMEWGLGRHGPGNNVFAYFVDPHGFAIEYTTEVEQIDEATYQPHTKEYWASFPERPCRWEMAVSPSRRLRTAMGGDYAAALSLGRPNR